MVQIMCLNLQKWEEIFANDMTDKGLISKSYKEIIQFNIKEANNLVFKNEQKIGIDIFPKKTCKWPTGICKGLQHY